MSRTSPKQNRELFLNTLRGYVGYTARAGRVTSFGAATGYDGAFWGGSMIDVAAKASNIALPAIVHPTAALAEFVRTNRLRRSPKVGDIVFYAFPSGGEASWATGAVGVVTDVSDWRSKASFVAIEGQTATGLPRGSQEPTGVYGRRRYSTDVIAFARPKFLTARLPKPAELAVDVPGQPVKRPVLRPSHFQPGKPSNTTTILQMSLAEVVGLRQAKRGYFDAQTQSAYAAWQRQMGYVGSDANGMPDVNSLARLSLLTGSLFEAKP